MGDGKKIVKREEAKCRGVGIGRNDVLAEEYAAVNGNDYNEKLDAYKEDNCPPPDEMVCAACIGNIVNPQEPKCISRICQKVPRAWELTPVEQIYNLEDENCLDGQTGKYVFDGTQFNFIDCKAVPSDLGDICSSDEDCEHNCITTDDDLEALGCPVVDCQLEQLSCKGIRGRCGTYGMDFKNIYQADMVNVYCLH